METLRLTYWQDGEDWLGYLEEFPDYWTQGSTFEDLKEHLANLRSTIPQLPNTLLG